MRAVAGIGCGAVKGRLLSARLVFPRADLKPGDMAEYDSKAVLIDVSIQDINSNPCSRRYS